MTSPQFGCRPYGDKVGVLVAQLGTPDEPTAKALRPYLRQFLSDPRVIEANRLVWWFVLNFLILPFRPKRSARLYKRIWGDSGSPLMSITKKQTDGLRERLRRRSVGIEVEFGMRYGTPSLEAAIDRLIASGCSRILLFPMYPQYAAATTASTYDVVFGHLLRRRWVPTLKVASPYYRHPEYIKALAAVINEGLASMEPKPERLLFSYHGIPERYVTNGDPYCCQCTETSRAVYPLLNIERRNVIHTYQSRFGKEPWLVPYTDETIEKLARDGVKRLAVFCPGFTADCLETLDEVGNEAREAFHENGGDWLRLIPCLNDHPAWMDAMEKLVVEELGAWCAVNEDCERLTCPVKEAKLCVGAG